MNRWLERLAKGLTTLGVAYFVLWACAPPAMMPPPVPLAAPQRSDVGLAASPQMLVEPGYVSGGLEGQVWYQRQMTNFDLGVVASGGYTGDVPNGSAGIFLRETYDGGGSSPVHIGWYLGLGWLHARVGVPVTVPISADGRSWFYTQPTVGISYRGLVHVPAGITTQVRDNLRVHMETGVHLLGYVDPPTTTYVSFGASWQR